MEWNEFFESRILDRGYDYYLSDLVSNISIKEDVIRATVFGSDDYHVLIYKEGNEISDMECECPYADKGYYCKHMAAVLYEAESIGFDIETDTNKDAGIDDIVEKADIDYIRKFLLDVLKNDKTFLVNLI